MANVIIQVSDQHFQLTARGSDMNLKFEDGWWVMYTVNATVRAYNYRGIPIPKFHKSLKQVEEKYKTWRGIEALAA